MEQTLDGGDNGGGSGGGDDRGGDITYIILNFNQHRDYFIQNTKLGPRLCRQNVKGDGVSLTFSKILMVFVVELAIFEQ